MGLARYLSKLAALVGSDGKVPTAGISDGAITTAKVADSQVTAAKLHTTAVTDKLGYTPVDVSNPILGSQTNAWHYIANTRIDGSAGFIRKSKRFAGNTAQNVFKWRTNYGWFDGQVRVRIHESGYIGGTYREIFLTGASGPNGYLVAQSYAPGVTNVTTQGYFGGYAISGSTGGGGVDVGYVDVTFTVTPSPYADCVVDVEFWGLTESASAPSKGQIQFL